MAETADATYMLRALNLAEKGRGKTSPNPKVGAVLVNKGEVVGEAYHRCVGKEHAERAVIKKAGLKAKGATLFVNLEPCCHIGRTGPCTETIIKAGIGKVVFSVRDPDPRVNGKGVRILKKAGVTVESGLLKKQALQLNESYFSYHKNKRPFVILKMAQTLDGRIATVTGDSKWISGPQSRKLAHRLRAEVDAVVVGMGTVRKDNPALTVRLVKGKNPYRIVLSQSLNFPRQCRLLDNNADYKTIIATNGEAIERFSRTKRGRRSLIYWSLRTDSDGLLDLHDFITKAGEFGFHSLLVEGGGSVAASFLKAGLVDKYIIVIAPLVLGSGISAVSDIRARKLADAVSFDRYFFQASGTDNVFVGYPKRTV
ncbi:MAG: bifunctional diaminohydroxyphosphoribosylaminopyrimidine deaminase/5-amino-6-(5-phosphoribosylamino)uracil reductase RibD [Candidatus Zixiibacteriota bacterium]|nr:MAG: bifunctional diaminohydroxyphosphoribosylaminopyrimidine deaminase/5-amino-6-(5-phosphoribosylamino)uracil reductase RibD [candidate division Zixibacteria bacterium]